MPAKAEKSNLKTIPYVNRATLNRPLRATKMCRPRCDECQEKGGAWWETCKHNPYFSVITVPGAVEYVTEVDEEGNEVILEEKPGPGKRIRTLNTDQVPNELKIYSGRGVQWSIEHGFKFPEELGFAPMCEYYNCWTPFPKFQTKLGNYCTEEQAQIINLRTRGVAIHAEPELRKEQLAGVSVG